MMITTDHNDHKNQCPTLRHSIKSLQCESRAKDTKIHRKEQRAQRGAKFFIEKFANANFLEVFALFFVKYAKIGRLPTAIAPIP